ncbi:integrase (plasmid) [Streptomyces globisporus C-1027]|uniref:Integrase n=1 Tax=Streptomyces globisporus C-1027 TaxID=1172567 RepID=A0A0U3LTI5_STRGL|nr:MULTISPECIES: site-specific integrase [Streptomyces]ALU98491.1 integrase [Streptomyces globisporus C-1027]KOG83100.1 integrase [Streptomyces griseus subsp. rhodochrous]
MFACDEVPRDLQSIRLARWGRVAPVDDVIPYVVEDPTGRPVEPIRRFLRDFVARGHSAGSVRSYAFDLHRWWRFLHTIKVPWDKATSAEVRDFVLWMGQAKKQRRTPRTKSAATAAQVNPITRKQHLGDGYGARTIRHSNAVLRRFYEFIIDAGEGPLVNPVRRDRGRRGRANVHHNPLEPFRPEGRLRYNPKVPRQRPRAMPDERWADFFAAMRSNRDRAILALALSTAARASELLGIRAADVDWGDQLVQVRRKGTGAQQWLPASAESFLWLRLYLDELKDLGPNDPVWWTLRRRTKPGEGLTRRPLNYDALRAVLRRANDLLGTNWTMHDLRHTSALRMVRSQKLSLRDVQVILGHAHLTTTQVYLVEDDDEVLRRVHRYLADRKEAAATPKPVAVGYDADDLSILLGGGAL